MPGREQLAAFVEGLAAPEAGSTDDATRVDLIAGLERLKSAAAAAQARLTVAFDASQRAQQASAGLRSAEQGKALAAQVALARRDSPVKGRRHLGLAKALVGEMPHTLAGLAAGRLSEWRATIMVRETAHLSAEHRTEVDRRLAGVPGRLDALGDKGVEREVRRLAHALDPAGAVRRARRATKDRTVTLRPAPDTMSYLTGLLPVAQGVAVHAALTRHADTLRSRGDSRSRGQIMADTLVERVTGQSRAEDVAVELHLVMTDRALLAGDNSPAHLHGYGPISAGTARDVVHGSRDVDGAVNSNEEPAVGREPGEARLRERARVWVRRLYTAATGELVAMERQRRELDGMLRRFVVIRDQFCRTPWCDAPIRHGDHVVPVAAGGSTTAANTQGLCEACNYAKESAGWSSTPQDDGSHSPAVQIETPTGHRYTSRAPATPGTTAA